LANELLSIKDFIGGMLIIAAIFLSARHQSKKDTL
jgi:drug/metabolite transporter (DMT)-like permease